MIGILALIGSLTLGAQATTTQNSTVLGPPTPQSSATKSLEVKIAEWSIAVAGTSAFGDTFTTGLVLGAGGTETNPALAFTNSKPLLFAAVKGAVDALVVWILIKKRHLHPRVVIAASALYGAVQVWATAHNYREWQKTNGR